MSRVRDFKKLRGKLTRKYSKKINAAGFVAVGADTYLSGLGLLTTWGGTIMSLNSFPLLSLVFSQTFNHSGRCGWEFIV